MLSPTVRYFGGLDIDINFQNPQTEFGGGKIKINQSQIHIGKIST